MLIHTKTNVNAVFDRSFLCIKWDMSYNITMVIENTSYTIIAIETPKGSAAAKILLDSGASLKINCDVLREMDLKPGAYVDPDALQEDLLLAEKEWALEKGLSYLEYGWRTEKQVRGYLKQKGFQPETIEHVITELKNKAFINDAAYAGVYVQNRSERRGESKNRINRCLLKRGIDADTAREALSGITEEDELAGAQNFIRKYKKSHASREGLELNRKVWNALRYHGYPPHIAAQAMKCISDEFDDKEGDSGS